MELLTSTTLDPTAGVYIRPDGWTHLHVNQGLYQFSLQITCRVLTVYLNCDVAAKTPNATTDGDSQQVFHYVTQS